MVEVQLANNHDLEAVRDVGDAVPAIGLQPVCLFFDFLALNVVHLANLVEGVLLDALVPLSVLLGRQKVKLVRQVAHMVNADAELLVCDLAVPDEDGLLARSKLSRLHKLRMRLTNLLDLGGVCQEAGLIVTTANSNLVFSCQILSLHVRYLFYNDVVIGRRDELTLIEQPFGYAAPNVFFELIHIDAIKLFSQFTQLY